MSILKTPPNRPAHVPSSIVYDFDIYYDVGLLSDPHERVRELLRDAPSFFWTPYNGGHWVALRYQDAFRILREPETFSSSPFTSEQKQAILASMPPDTPRIIEPTPILMDPPLHTKFRAPLQRAFSPKMMMKLRDDIKLLTEQLIGDVVNKGSCDFFAAVAEQLPVRIFLKMMGLPEERLIEFRELVREVFAPGAEDPIKQAQRLRNIVDAMMPVLLARRVDPRDDLISELWALEVDGEPMTMTLMEDYGALLFLAGLDTVINAISFGVRHLALDMAFQEELRAKPELIVDATEELLRRYTFTISMRRATRDVELAGQTVAAGDIIIIYMPAADLDPAEFAEPERFDPLREHKVHMAFGVGPHRCLGSHLARIELQTLYEVVLRKLPPFRLDPCQPVTFHAGMLFAIGALPLRWD